MQALLKCTLRNQAQWHTCGTEAAPLVQALPRGLWFAVLSSQWHPGLYSGGLNSTHVSVSASINWLWVFRGADISRHFCAKESEDSYA